MHFFLNVTQMYMEESRGKKGKKRLPGEPMNLLNAPNMDID